MIETLIDCVYGKDENESKRSFAYTQFMTVLESTVNDLAKSFLQESGDDKSVSFGRIYREVKDEIGE